MRRRPFVATAILFLVLLGGASFAGAAEEEAHGGWFEPVSRIVNFAILVGGLVYLLRRPLGNYLDARSLEIRTRLADAAEKRTRADAERREAEKRLAGLDEEIARVRAQAEDEARAERERILRSAEEETARLAEMARREIAAELEIARRKLVSRATELAIEVARQKIEREMTEADQKALIDRSIATLKEVR